MLMLEMVEKKLLQYTEPFRSHCLSPSVNHEPLVLLVNAFVYYIFCILFGNIRYRTAAATH